MTIQTTAAQELLDQVIATMKDTPDPRLREIATSLVRHLHEFAAEVNLTQAEWMYGMQFLTAVGQYSKPDRNEFILLSDVIGLSSLVETINQDSGDGATEATVLGPFYIPDAPRRANGQSMVETPDSAPELHIRGTIRGTDGAPIAGATIDAWQANSTTDADGNYEIVTTRPVSYPVPTDGPVGPMLRAMDRSEMRATHVHLLVAAPGYQTVVTHVFDAECRYLKTDAVFSVKESLVRKFEPIDGHFETGFDVTLTPAREARTIVAPTSGPAGH
jgi:protocatechuate 3,4-dioxygenase beta subunit